MQVTCWPALAEQLKLPLSIVPTTSAAGTVSPTDTLSASESPEFVTAIVKLCEAPPAVTVALSNVFVVDFGSKLSSAGS